MERPGKVIVDSVVAGDNNGFPALRIGHMQDKLLGCPALGKVPPLSTVSAEDDTACWYDGNLVATDAVAMEAYTRERRDEKKDPSWFDHPMMGVFCSTRADPSKCPIESRAYADAVGPICSNMVNSWLCQSWARGSDAGKRAADDAMLSWCETHTDRSAPFDPSKSDPACACLSREYSSEYQAAQKAIMAPVNCWYSPCTDTDLKRYMVPSTLVQQKDCKGAECAIVNNWVNSEVDIGQMKQYMTCSGDSNGGGPTWWGSMDATQKVAMVSLVGCGALAMFGVGMYYFKK